MTYAEKIKKIKQRQRMNDAELSRILCISDFTLKKIYREQIEADKMTQQLIDGLLNCSSNITEVYSQKIKELKFRYNLSSIELAEIIGCQTKQVEAWEAMASAPRQLNREIINYAYEHGLEKDLQ